MFIGLSSGLGYFASLWGAGPPEASRVMAFQALAPITAVVIELLGAAYPPTWRLAGAFVLVLSGVWFGTREGRAPRLGPGQPRSRRLDHFPAAARGVAETGVDAAVALDRLLREFDAGGAQAGMAFPAIGHMQDERRHGALGHHLQQDPGGLVVDRRARPEQAELERGLVRCPTVSQR